MRVDIGRGATPTGGWVDIDNSRAVPAAGHPLLLRTLRLVGPLGRESLGLRTASWAENIRCADAVRRIPSPGSAADVVYCVPMIEHLDHDEARRCPGEVRRLAAPDLGLLVDDFLSGRDAADFMRRTYLTQPRPAGLLPRLRAAMSGSRHHLRMYDGASLTALLRRAGCIEVAVRPAGETAIPDPGSLDLKERAEESV